MNYIQISYNLENCEEFIAELLPTFLAEVGFDSFEETTNGLNAYCPKNLFSETEMIATMHNLPCCFNDINYTIEDVEDLNWNETWEKESFRPIQINERCCVRPSGHETEMQYEFDIIVNPTQSFGTGYHETTRMVMNAMFNTNLNNNNILDMGCGTAVLSILAEKLGAKHITAIDIDRWSADNAKDNAAMNNCNNIEVHLGDADSLSSIPHSFDIVLANINRNILLNDMAKYVQKMNNNAIIIMSGFLVEDYPLIEEKATTLSLSPLHKYEDNNWICCSFLKA